LQILKLGGANVLKREPNPESIPPNESTIPFHAKADSSLSKCSHLIIFHVIMLWMKKPKEIGKTPLK